MASSLRQVLQTYSEICIFCRAIQYILSKKEPVWSAHELLAESLGTAFDDETHFTVNLHNFLQLLALARNPFSPKWAISPRSPQVEQLPKLLSSRHIRSSFSVYLFLNSEPQVGKSKEFNNQGLIVSRNFKYYIVFLPSKTIKNRQALHETIRALSLSMIFVEFSLQPVSLTMVTKIFKFMEIYCNSWKMYLQVKILTLDIFSHVFFNAFFFLRDIYKLN